MLILNDLNFNSKLTNMVPGTLLVFLYKMTPQFSKNYALSFSLSWLPDRMPWYIYLEKQSFILFFKSLWCTMCCEDESKIFLSKSECCFSLKMDLKNEIKMPHFCGTYYPCQNEWRNEHFKKNKYIAEKQL